MRRSSECERHIPSVHGRYAQRRLGDSKIHVDGRPNCFNSAERPSRLLVETMIDGYGTVRICFDGTNAWQSEPNQPLRRLSSSVIQDLREEADLMPANHLSDRVKSVRLQGHNTVNQIHCNRVQVICNDGSEVFEDFSRATSLLVARSKPDRATELYGEYLMMKSLWRRQDFHWSFSPERTGPTATLGINCSVR